ncbi:hypothetical protein RJ53_11230 [Methanocalculus chunghsingensis]|uniref:Uncharacterized protein n=1 Tax=Methanocalculus chunghsingensis TaxID=156457 RepID=A0A8J7W7V9_9EURY|nr:hypothetical protein [Methanocalculus chunghsingensis]
MSFPEGLTQMGERLKEFLSCDSFEDLHHRGGSMLGMSGDEKMNVIGHNLLLMQEKTPLVSYGLMQLSQSLCNVPNQDFTPVFHRPYEMVINIVYAASRAYPMLGFYH